MILTVEGSSAMCCACKLDFFPIRMAGTSCCLQKSTTDHESISDSVTKAWNSALARFAMAVGTFRAIKSLVRLLPDMVFPWVERCRETTKPQTGPSMLIG